MLTDGIAEAFRSGRDRVAAGTGVRAVLTTTCDLRNATPYLFEVSGADWLADHMLAEEVFGPLGLIVRVRHVAEMRDLARSLQGQLTCTLHLDDEDIDLAKTLMPILERKAGRVLANGFPTGVEVCDAMVHGGPFPATSDARSTSVGTAAIQIAKAAGARVIAAASTDEKCALCTSLGADATINYSTQNLRDELKTLTEGKGPDVIYDPVGGEMTEQAFRSIAWRGRHLIIGFANGFFSGFVVLRRNAPM